MTALRKRGEFLRLGRYNVICDRCGFKYKNYECKIEWDNLFVCEPCWEIRQPQDFVKGIPDRQVVPIPRPDVPPTFITP